MRRKKAVDHARDGVIADGGTISSEIEKICHHYIMGELTLKQFGEAISEAVDSRYKRLLESDELDYKQIKKLVDDASVRRIVELEFKPIKGKFDTEHLKAIHRYIMQDAPKYDPLATPGETRPDLKH